MNFRVEEEGPTGMNANNVYEIRDLEYSYSAQPTDHPRKFQVGGAFRLRIPEMNIRRGTVTIVVGRSGSGKTTLLSILGILRRPSRGGYRLHLVCGSGNLILDSTHLWKDEQKAEMLRAHFLGFALQTGELFEHLSVLENVEFPLRILRRKNPLQTASAWLDRFFDESDKVEKERRPSGLSLGQYQRCALARALVHQPQVVLADEPTGNLDVITGKKLLQLLKEYVCEDSRRSVILVTHDLHYALEYGDEVYVLSEGRITAHYGKCPPFSWPSIQELEDKLTMRRHES